ncbi:MAG: YdcF family protein [Verrucomicrobiae bacterium]|nr:YdcF family protein [Verrucomicrobiae bacterium]
MSHWLASMVDPLALLWLGLCGSAAWLAWKRRWRAAAVVGSPAGILFLLGSLPWPEALVAAREAPYAERNVAPAPAADAVVMLGGIHDPSVHDPYGFALRAGSQRLVAAVQLVREGKGQALVLGGSGPLPGQPDESAASLLSAFARQWQLSQVELLDLGICQNTRAEAVRIQQLKAERGWERITIVTSALHMERAEATMRKLDSEVAIVACDFRIYGVKQEPWKTFPFPTTDRLKLLHDYLHEVVGGWVYRWRGWI